MNGSSNTGPAAGRDGATLTFYAGAAQAYTAAAKGPSRWLDAFMAGLPAGGRVLDLGCGGGIDAAAMSARGFDVTASDGSPAMAAAAALRLGRPVRVMLFDELTERDAYDGIWANASLLHVPRAALAGVLSAVHRALKPGGLHFATYKAGSGAGRDRLGRYYNYPDRTTLDDVYAAAGAWDRLAMTGFTGDGYEGGAQAWLAVTARRPAA